ncbi:MAG: disulfide bond formation protein B [Anaerolineae bacterium]|nr:disulfide bond formation protein B [Anaerolineae bacterium]
MTKLRDFLLQYGAYLALIPALAALLGSLYYSEVAGFIPCTLCWYQRILMYPLSIIILVGILTHDELLTNYVLPFSIMGLGVALYHYLIQQGVFSHPTTCAAGIPCDMAWVNYLGFITIPFMSLTAFTLITIIMGATKWAEMQVTE